MPAKLPDLGEVLGAPYPDWPEELATFAERKAYQLGVAHARVVSRQTLSELIAHYATIAHRPDPSASNKAYNFGEIDGRMSESRGIAGRLNYLIKEGKL